VFHTECRDRRKQQGRGKARPRRDSGSISRGRNTAAALLLAPEGKPVNTRLRRCTPWQGSHPCLRPAGSALGVRVASCTRVLAGFLSLHSVWNTTL